MYNETMIDSLCFTFNNFTYLVFLIWAFEGYTKTKCFFLISDILVQIIDSAFGDKLDL